MRALRLPFGTLVPVRAARAAEQFAVLRDRAIYGFENAPPAAAAA